MIKTIFDILYNPFKLKSRKMCKHKNKTQKSNFPRILKSRCRSALYFLILLNFLDLKRTTENLNFVDYNIVFETDLKKKSLHKLQAKPKIAGDTKYQINLFKS